MPQKKTTKPKSLDFEKALNDLETLALKLEQGDLSLEDSLKEFERGVSLTRDCQKALENAEKKVAKLLQTTQHDD